MFASQLATMYVIIAVCILFFLMYIYGSKNHGYWKKKGIKYEKPIPFLGTEYKLLISRSSMAVHYADIYWRYPTEKVVGIYRGNDPYLLIRDPELAKHVFTSDFYTFNRRGIVPSKDDQDPMFQNLFSVDGDKWKLLRQRLTPMFSSAKLKAMFPLIEERAEKLKDLAADAVKSAEVVDIRELMARYTTDFIGACAFGIDMDSLGNENSNFRELGKRMFAITFRDVVVGTIKVMFPSFGANLSYVAPEIEKGVLYLMRTVMKQRNYKPSNRNDFIDILLELKEKGTIVGESIEFKNTDGTPMSASLEIDDHIMAAQVYIFFAAGFETSSSASSFALHLLAFHPEEQKKVHEEIDRVVQKYNNKINYDSIQDMKYLEMVLNESLRILPPLGMLHRKSVAQYTFPGTDITIDSDVGIIVPSYGFHNDPKYFDNPDEFRPERFHPDNAKNLCKVAFLPFGEGYRSCIGARLGMMQSLAGIATVLQKYEVLPAPTSRRHPILGTGVTQSIVGGLPLLLKERK